MAFESFKLGGVAARADFLPPQEGGGGPRPVPPRGAEVGVEHLSKAYGGQAVLRDVSLRLAPGEFVAIVGRSGCGKSTLLRQVAGLEQPDAGLLRIRGDDGGRGTRIMFQDARLLPWKSVLDNVALGLPLPEGRKRARRALEQVGLAKRAMEWPAVLSGGQRQRVALARALVHEPRLLLLDEPLGALDALTRIEMQQLIHALWREHGFTALLVTHDVSEAVALADRVVLIEQHRIAFDEAVPLPHPRSRADPGFAAFEDRVLQRLLQPAPSALRAHPAPGAFAA
ncbi:ATP-binding cassette domain-containing protein [Azohydromonas aeria]|uniref:ATP-binding cassette domain-containing protein n=1 Tax=Azohydromonas aeria TaxID=2590212 RepID=UPI001E554223|nr:ATP-binding cassette domain-containing protein [Azohydromonas aeria]